MKRYQRRLPSLLKGAALQAVHKHFGRASRPAEDRLPRIGSRYSLTVPAPNARKHAVDKFPDFQWGLPLVP